MILCQCSRSGKVHAQVRLRILGNGMLQIGNGLWMRAERVERLRTSPVSLEQKLFGDGIRGIPGEDRLQSADRLAIPDEGIVQIVPIPGNSASIASRACADSYRSSGFNAIAFRQTASKARGTRESIARGAANSPARTSRSTLEISLPAKGAFPVKMV